VAGKERRAKLTDEVVQAAKPELQRYYIWDTETRGFGLRVEPSGHKAYILRYRANGGGRNAPRRQMNLRALPGIMATAKVRKLAKDELAKVARGEDPVHERSAKRREMTMTELCELYMEEGVEHKKASTLAVDKGRLERHIKPLLGRRLLSDVSHADVDRMRRDIAKGKTATEIRTKPRGIAKVRGGNAAANRVVGLLGGIFSFAMRRGLRADNPARGIKPYADRKRERFLSGAELAILGDTLRAFEAAGSNQSALAIIRLLMFTGARKSEIARLKWSEVDFHRSCLRLEESKSGQKVIAIGPPALAILSQIQCVEGKPWVFPAEAGDEAFQGTEKCWRKVRKLADMPDLRLHDLRHSFASVALAAGDSLPLIGKMLGHADSKTTQRYAHLADDPVKTATDRTANAIAAALGATSLAEVIPLKKAR
jgi:integrase